MRKTTSSTSPPPSPRTRLEKIRNQPKTRTKRQKRVATVEHDEDEIRQQEILLNRETRWITFLYHSTHEELKVIEVAFGEAPAIESSSFRYGHFKIQDLVKGYKSQTLGHVEVS